VAQLTDGVVALPEDARTREHLEWVADQVLEASGTALLLRAEALSAADERTMAQAMAAARSEEYSMLAVRAAEALNVGRAERERALKRLRRDLRTVQRRDYFPPAERDHAVAALNALAAAVHGEQPEAATPATSPGPSS